MLLILAALCAVVIIALSSFDGSSTAELATLAAAAAGGMLLPFAAPSVRLRLELFTPCLLGPISVVLAVFAVLPTGGEFFASSAFFLVGMFVSVGIMQLVRIERRRRHIRDLVASTVASTPSRSLADDVATYLEAVEQIDDQHGWTGEHPDVLGRGIRDNPAVLRRLAMSTDDYRRAFANVDVPRPFEAVLTELDQTLLDVSEWCNRAASTVEAGARPDAGVWWSSFDASCDGTATTSSASSFLSVTASSSHGRAQISGGRSSLAR